MRQIQIRRRPAVGQYSNISAAVTRPTRIVSKVA